MFENLNLRLDLRSFARTAVLSCSVKMEESSGKHALVPSAYYTDLKAGT